MKRLEKDIENRLVKKIKAMGGQCYKWVSPGNAGVPDRIVLLPGGFIAFVELKRDKEVPRKIQLRQLQKILNLGQQVFVIKGLSGVDQFCETCREWLNGSDV
ncbi:MAG: VRR-NUC domain-containing protein [Tissierellia bacterium]|nr:VRR-NUC domain-containing protein [Tissierellia bacterium]